MESAPFGIIIGDAEGEIYHVNTHFTELTGYTREDIPDRETWFEKAYPDPDYRAEMKKTWIQYMKSEEAKVEAEFRITCRDGSKKTIKFKANRLENNNIILTLEDVTEQRRTERDLEASKNKLDTIVRAVGAPLYMLAENLEITWANGEAKKLFDRQLVGKKCYRAFLQREDPCPDCVAKRVFAEEEKHSHGFEIEDDSGKERFFHCTFNVAQYKPNGQPRTVLGVLQDQTKVRKRKRALKLFRTLMDETQEGVFIINPETGKVLDANRTACRRLGYSRKQLQDMHAWEITESFADEQDYREQKLPITEKGETIETSHKHKDGSTFPVEVTVSDVEIEDNRYRVAVARDISESKKMQKKLKHKSKEMEQFAYAASHDLRKPINKLFAFCDFLERDLANDEQEQAREHLERLRETADDMDDLITELLSLSRVGTEDLTKKEVELEHCVQKCLDLFDQEIEQKDARVEKNISGQVQGDPTLLQQLFKNLIGNALKFSEGSPNIKLTDQVIEDEVLIRVEDNGPGIPEDKAKEIFHPMFRGPETETEGTGLGLAICKKIVERHDGEIQAENIAGRGARFEIKLPVANN